MVYDQTFYRGVDEVGSNGGRFEVRWWMESVTENSSLEHIKKIILKNPR